MFSVGHICIGLIWTLFFGHFSTSIIVNELWKYIQKQEDSERPYEYTAIFVGLVERTLYFFAILYGFKEFIGVWLVLKVAGVWRRWEEDKNEKGKSGRVFYNIFLIGSGISLGFAFTGVNLVHLFHNEEYAKTWIAPVALIIGLTIFWGLICVYQKEDLIRKVREKIRRE